MLSGLGVGRSCLYKKATSRYDAEHWPLVLVVTKFRTKFRLRATHRALSTALPNVNDVPKMYIDRRRLKYAHKTSFAWVEG